MFTFIILLFFFFVYFFSITPKILTGVIAAAIAAGNVVLPQSSIFNGFAQNAISVHAEFTDIERDYRYRILEDNTVEIAHYEGTKENIVIPSMIAGRVVTAIDGWGGDTPTNPNEHATGVRVGAFEDCTDVKSVTIPKSVKSIDKHAFGYNDIEDKPLNEIKILCYADSYAEKFAKDEDFDYSIIAHENHDYTYTVVRPTYSSTGYTICQCEICGDWYKTDPKDKLVLGSVSNIKSNPTFNSVKLSWDKVNNADGYIVYKYDNAKKNWIRVAKTQMAKNSYTVSKLNASTAYKFAVKAYKTVNGKELTSPSYPTAQVVTRPGVVSGFKAASNSTNSVKLSWNKTVRADGYIVYRYDYNKKTWIRLTKTSGTNYTATGLASGTSYKFAVKAYNTINGKDGP